MKTDTRRYDDASGQELYRPKQGEKMVTVGGYTRDECENLANMVKAAPNKAQQWTEQARNAIRQGQDLNEFILHCHPDSRREARKAYMRLIVRRPTIRF